MQSIQVTHQMSPSPKSHVSAGCVFPSSITTLLLAHAHVSAPYAVCPVSVITDTRHTWCVGFCVAFMPLMESACHQEAANVPKDLDIDMRL